MPRVPDRWWVSAVGSLALALAFVAVLLVRADGDPSRLVHAGPTWTHPAETRGSLTVQPPDQAFDGQFFYRLGVDPWSEERIVAGVEHDLPSLRNARWGYGALAWVASAGDPDLVPWSLIGVNLVAAFALGAAGAGLARSSGRHAAWGLLFVLWPGFAYSLSLDTSELVASAFVVGGLLAGRHRRWSLVALSLSAAVITRDTTAVVPFGFAAAGAIGLWRSRRDDRRDIDSEAANGIEPFRGLLVAGFVPLLVFGTWQMVQRARFGSLPLTSSGDNNLSVPLGGFVDLFRDAASNPSGEAAFRVLFALGIVAIVALAAWALGRSTAPLSERLAWIPAVIVVLVLNAYLWSGATAFMRAATEVGILSTAIVLAVPSTRRLPTRSLAAGLSCGWLLTAVSQVSKLG